MRFGIRVRAMNANAWYHAASTRSWFSQLKSVTEFIIIYIVYFYCHLLCHRCWWSRVLGAAQNIALMRLECSTYWDFSDVEHGAAHAIIPLDIQPSRKRQIFPRHIHILGSYRLHVLHLPPCLDWDSESLDSVADQCSSCRSSFGSFWYLWSLRLHWNIIDTMRLLATKGVTSALTTRERNTLSLICTVRNFPMLLVPKYPSHLLSSPPS